MWSRASLTPNTLFHTKSWKFGFLLAATEGVCVCVSRLGVQVELDRGDAKPWDALCVPCVILSGKFVVSREFWCAVARADKVAILGCLLGVISWRLPTEVVS